MTPDTPRPSSDRVPPTEEKIGTVRVAPEVLATIAALTAQEVAGVVRLKGGIAGEVGKIIKRGQSMHGVKVTVVDNEVWVELHIIVRPDVSMYKVGRDVQDAVARALETMVGMPVHTIDVYIEDVE